MWFIWKTIEDDSSKIIDSNNQNYIKSTLKCQKSHEFCTCGRPIHEGNCYHDGKEFQKLIDKEHIKKCPKCGFLIKKHKGCNHMICGNPTCRYESPIPDPQSPIPIELIIIK